MELSNSMKQQLCSVVDESIRGYEFTPLVLDMIRFLLRSVYGGLMLFDKEQKIQFMDKSSENLFGLEPGGAKNFEIKDLISGEEKDLISAEEIEKTIFAGLPVIGLRGSKGQKRIIVKFPLKKNGKVVGAIGRGVFHNLEEIENLYREIEVLKAKIIYYRGQKSGADAHYTFDDLLGDSKAFKKTKELAMRAAAIDATILLEGESGTGKELFAHSIHNASRRRNKPFIRVNCPSIPLELAESELFGYEKGAFSGARNEGKPGKFELAEGGTVFLDEIGSLPLSIQAKLLRVLQEREIERLGGRNTIKVNFRLIAATNISLEEGATAGRFRADLYYRLNEIPIKILPLRERLEDIALLTSHFLKQINTRSSSNISHVSEEAFSVMMSYKWPGNIRELANILEQSALSLSEGNIIQAENLPSFVSRKIHSIDENGPSLRYTVRDAEKQAVERALAITSGNKRRAAELLGIQRCALYQKLKKYGLSG